MTWTDMLGLISCVLTVAVVWSARVRPPQGAPPPMRSAGRVAFLLGLGITTASSTFVIAHGPDSLRVPVAVVAALLAPGYAIVVLRRLDSVVDELTMALAIGFAALVLAGTAMAGTGIWEPLVLLGLSTVVTAPVLTRQATYLFLLPVAATETVPTNPDRDS